MTTTALLRAFLLISQLALAVSCAQSQQQSEDFARAGLEHIRVLAADSLQGRETGTPGNRMAMEYIEQEFRAAGLAPVDSGYRHAFTVDTDEATVHGVNLIGLIRGTKYPDRAIVITAHYDHVGVRDGQIYNGADDNASGVAGLLAAAHWFRRHAPATTLIFAALDAEEKGLLGATALLKHPPVPLEQIRLNINLDMISRSSKKELYAAGTAHYPWLKPLLTSVARPDSLRLLFGHDTPEHGAQHDWTLASDHGVFHQHGIPFIYFGVEDHEDYHKPSDDFSKTDRVFFIDAVHFITRAIAKLDAHIAGDPVPQR